VISAYSLQRYRLSRRALRALGNRKVRLEVFLGFPRYPSSLWPSLTAPQRKARVSEWLRDRYRSVVARWELRPIPRLDSVRSPSPFLHADVAARDVPALERRLKGFELRIDAIEGRKPHREPTREPGWIAVRALVAQQLRGETRGLQTVEDRILLVRAWDFEEAEQKLRAEWKAYAEPWISTTGHLVRSKLERIVGWYDLIDDPLDPNGAEVWSSFSKRRLKPQYVWRAAKAASRSRSNSPRIRR